MPVSVRIAVLTVAFSVAGAGLAGASFAQGSASFSQLAGPQGCHVQAGDQFDGIEGCTRTRGLIGAQAVEISPDERHVYVASRGYSEFGSNAVVAFSRDQGNGALTFAGCISDSGGDGRVGTDGFCVNGDALLGAGDLEFSPDGRFLYVTSAVSGGLAWFERDPESGLLTQRGCVKALPRRDRCIQSIELDGARELAVSPDGRHLYVTAENAATVTVFALDEVTGAPGQVMCVSNGGTDGACLDGTGLERPIGVVVAPGGADVYVTSGSGALTSYRRDATTGALEPSGCLLDGAVEGGSCVRAPTLGGAADAAVTPDGHHLLVAAPDESALTVFTRHAGSGRLDFHSCLKDASTAAPEPPGEDPEPADDAQARDPLQCRSVDGLISVRRVTISRDGRGVFALTGGVLAAFRRDPGTGALESFGCASQDSSSGSCSRAPSLYSGSDLVASGDARSLYVTSERGISIFAASVAIATRVATMGRSGQIKVRLACPQARRRPCAGRLSAGRSTARDGGSARYRMRPGTRVVRSLRLPSRARVTVRRRSRARVMLIAQAAGSETRASVRRVVVRDRR